MSDFQDFISDIAEATGESYGVVEKAAREGMGQLLNSFPQYAGGNGVQMPGPMDEMHPYDVEAGFEETGADMSGVASGTPNTNNGGQLAVPPSQFEPGFVFGKDLRGLALRQSVPVGMDFGVESDMGHNLTEAHGDESGMSVIGTVSEGSGSDFYMPLVSDIVPVFEKLRDKFGQVLETDVGSPIPGAAMSGLPLAPGSGVLGDRGGYIGGEIVHNDEQAQNKYPGGQPLRPEFEPAEGAGMDRVQPRIGAGPRKGGK